MVLVSIIIPTYNRKDLLIKAVESILLQTYSNWELLIINDYENPIKLNFNDTRISIKNNKFTKGGNGARNTGLSMAKGNFIAFLDDDDEWEKDKLSKQQTRQHRTSSPLLNGSHAPVPLFPKNNVDDYNAAKPLPAADIHMFPLPQMKEPVRQDPYAVGSTKGHDTSLTVQLCLRNQLPLQTHQY